MKREEGVKGPRDLGGSRSDEDQVKRREDAVKRREAAKERKGEGSRKFDKSKEEGRDQVKKTK